MQKNVIFLSTLILTTFFAPIFVKAEVYYCTHYFSKNIEYGEYNNDVLELQRFLNSDDRSEIATSGPG